MKKVKSIVEVSSYLLLIAFSSMLIYQQVFSKAPEDLQNIAVGDTYEELKNIVPAGASEALLLALSPDCPYCEKSMAFYQELINSRDKSKSKLQVIAAVHNDVPTDMEKATLDEHNVAVDQLVQLDFALLKIMGVPAMLLVDDEGEVQEIWKGQPNESMQKEILELL